MTLVSKTNNRLIYELTSLQDQAEPDLFQNRETGSIQWNFGERLDRYMPKAQNMIEAIYVIFDRKYEFVNRKFAQLFHSTPEEICNTEFDPMTLIAPESRSFIKENHRKGYRGEVIFQQYEYTGITMDGSKIQCETSVVFIPYKWGVAIQGTLRNTRPHNHIARRLQQIAFKTYDIRR